MHSHVHGHIFAGDSLCSQGALADGFFNGYDLIAPRIIILREVRAWFTGSDGGHLKSLSVTGKQGSVESP